MARRSHVAFVARAAAVSAAVAGATLWGAAPARADGEWLRVNPTTIQAGFSVSIQASCGTDVNPAKVKSDAFGEQMMLPQSGSNYLYAVVTVPASTKAQGYTVTLTCATGGRASTTLWVINMGTPTKGPNTGGGGLASGAGGGTGSAVLLGGLATVAAGGLLGLAALRRRKGDAANAPVRER